MESGEGRVISNLIYRLRSFYLLFRFIANTAGKEYGIGPLEKFLLARRMIQNNKRIKALTRWQEHLFLVEEIFRVPKSLKGDVVECGCYNGASTVNLSLACALTQRRLFVCDSFEGLSRPEADEKCEIYPGSTDSYFVYEAGDYSSEEGLEGVKRNVTKFGDPEVCRFVQGYFKDTLKDLNTDSIVFIFEDADLASSVEHCLRYLWPKLQEGCKFYSHEAWSVPVVSLFYDKRWWEDHFGTRPPGFYGSGTGILPGFGFGYAWKLDLKKITEQGKKLRVQFRQLKGGQWSPTITPEQ